MICIYVCILTTDGKIKFGCLDRVNRYRLSSVGCLLRSVRPSH